MSSVVIVTDSSADIESGLRQEFGIEIVPLKVLFGTESYLDGITMTSAEFFAKLTSSSVMPTTSQPSPVEWAEKYKEIVEKHGKDVSIIVITISSALSGTYQSAVIGKTMLEDDTDITIIDSKKGSFIQGIAVVAAARAAQAGQTKQQVLDLTERILREMKEFFVVDTLQYLQKGGRIGKASALIGSLLNIKPILSLDSSGSVYPFDKVRGTKKAVSRMLEELKAYAGNEKVAVGIIHATNEDEANNLRERVREEFNVVDDYIAEIGPVVGTHIGPGAIACVMYKV
ncbi:DegV family protein [Brevibacillus dissolubilis]|uniref:DegV family protein n=1 Tax=Brevibacillus dissolubilis TaxID=1844116 RepID=UPI001116851A|nr:DegV family protein [Brevibacillus dissolubilis]